MFQGLGGVFRAIVRYEQVHRGVLLGIRVDYGCFRLRIAWPAIDCSSLIFLFVQDL
jgi:hypothetical protein